MITANYRQDYQGEFVLLETKFGDREKKEKREWVPNAIENNHISGRAAVIGSDIDKSMFDFSILARHKGSLLGKKKLQTYGAGTVWSDMKFDFFTTNEKKVARTLHENKYFQDTVIYTTPGICMTWPGDFYLIPYGPQICSLAVAIYLAAFDQHREIFLIGYNNDTPFVDSNWQTHVNDVFQTYSDTQFILVGAASNMPTVWRENRNVSTMKYREFVSYCDV